MDHANTVQRVGADGVMLQRRDLYPGWSSIFVKNDQPATDGIDLGIAGQGTELLLQACRMHQVVGIHARDVFAAGLAHDLVQSRRQSEILAAAVEDVDPAVLQPLQDLHAAVGRTIVDDE